MKRTNLVLNEDVLEKARTITGMRTYSEVVNFALSELIRRKTFDKIDAYANSNIWEGDLASMRRDT